MKASDFSGYLVGFGLLFGFGLGTLHSDLMILIDQNKQIIELLGRK